jgi:hypothetical protein
MPCYFFLTFAHCKYRTEALKGNTFTGGIASPGILKSVPLPFADVAPNTHKSATTQPKNSTRLKELIEKDPEGKNEGLDLVSQLLVAN